MKSEDFDGSKRETVEWVRIAVFCELGRMSPGLRLDEVEAWHNPGDVLERDDVRREVTEVHDNGRNILYRSGRGYGKVYLCIDSVWRDWASGATVVTKGSV